MAGSDKRGCPTAEFVLEAAFVGIPDEKWGQRPMAIVSLVPGAKQDENDVFDHLKTEGVGKGKITTWMLPDYIVITGDIPKTSVGKFDKKVMRAAYADGAYELQSTPLPK